MLYAVTLYYLCSESELGAHIDAHKKWLVEGISKAGVILAGPLTSGTGGYILFHVDNEKDIYAYLEKDPFVIHNKVTVNVLNIEPMLCSNAFPPQWAANAKLI